MPRVIPAAEYNPPPHADAALTPPATLQVPADAADIRGRVIELLTDDSLSIVERRTRIALEVVNALASRGRFYFHVDLREFDSAMYFDGERKVLERIQSDEFVAWLSEWLRVNRADALFKFIIAAVETAGLSGPHTTAILPESYWAFRPGAIYLSNGDGAAVKITAEGLQTVDNGTDSVLFTAGRTLTPWNRTEPEDPFVTCSVFRNAHCNVVHGPDLLRVWIYSLPTNPRSKPPLCLVGDVGSGKTRTAKAITELFGLPFVAQKVEDDAENQFWPSVDQGGVFTLDNADTRCKWLADALANAATDGCTQRRKLYTDRETVILRARAWIVVTTANPTFASDAGLADRLLVVRMGRRSEETSDAVLTDEIVAARNGALSHIAHTLQLALADTVPTPPGLNERHPDFGAFAVRIGRAISREAECIAAIEAAEMDKSAFCLENDPVGSAVVAFMANRKLWEGTAAELLERLKEIDPDMAATRPNGKPEWSSKRLGRRLSMLWPHLEKSFASATKEPDRKGATVFSFNTAECAGFQSSIS